MTKKEIAAILAERSGITQRLASKVIDNFLGIITDVVADGDRIVFSGFGAFETKETVSRNRVNPNTGKIVVVPSKRLPAFRPGKTFKNKIR